MWENCVWEYLQTLLLLLLSNQLSLLDFPFNNCFIYYLSKNMSIVENANI